MNIIRPKLYLQIPTVFALATGLALTQLAGAAPTWNNAAGGNWSDGGNWSPSGVPGTADNVIFGNIGAGLPNTNDVASETIDALTYDWSNGSQQTTVIPSGQTLTVTSSLAAGSALLLAGSATAAPAAGTLAPAAISGGGSLVLSGLGDLVVHLGQGTAGAHMATLDLSGLASLTANVGRLLIGQANAGAAVNRPSGTLILAATNTITLTGASPQVMLQDSGSNANGSTASVLTFGQVNYLNGDTMRLGGQKGNANINFNPAFSLPSLTIRNADGVSPCTVIDFGYNAAVSTGNSTVAAADFSAGTIDLLANRVNVPQGPIGTGTGTSIGTLTLGAGTFNVSDFEIAWGNATGASGVTTGTVNVNNNGSFPAGALVQVPTLLRLARTNGGSAVVTGTLNINGGTVEANTIVSGGGVSVINVNSSFPSSTLTISNTAGTLTAPIGTFSVADATLNIPALNGGATIAVKTLTIGGSGNTINISSIPPIGSYPADFTLINYQNGYTAGTGPILLGTKPAGYTGTLVDSVQGVITLHLTAGPVANLGMFWTGAADNNWDLTTYDWNFLSVATNFFNGSSPIFNDTTTQTNVVLTTTLSPGSILVSNNVNQYTFTGSGNLTGVGTLTKKGSGSLIVANQGLNEIGTVVINGGTLQIGTNDQNGSISVVNITNNAALVVNRSGTINLAAAISGTGSLTENGSGTLILSGANSYSGTTTVSGGTLEIDGTSSGAGALTASTGTVLAGSGTNNGAITVGGQMNPGPSVLGGMGTFTANGDLTLNSGSTPYFDLSAANPAVSDSINVGGNLNVNNNVITVNFDGAPAGGQYMLFNHAGSLSGSFNPTIVGTHYAVVLEIDPNIVYLNVTGGSGSILSWASTSDSTWDNSTVNWLDTDTGLPSAFNAGDTVLLNDSNGVVTTLTIPPGVNVAPLTITDTATNNSFIINGAGAITGSAGIVMSGPSTLEIDTANTFSGGVDVQAGTLKIGNTSALGSTAAGTTVEAGATLDINGQNVVGEAITISGAGIDGTSGALVNNDGASPVQSLRTLILQADATVGGSGPLLMNNSGGAATLTGAVNLTKTGAGQFTFQNLTTVDLGLQNIDIQQGIMELSGLTPGMGDPTFTNTVEAGATLSFQQTTVAWNKQFVFNGDGSTTTLNIGTGGNPELDGPIVLHGGCVFNVGGVALTITNTISGDGGVIKNGGSPMILTGSTTYTGDTTLNAAALRLQGSADLSMSTNIIINAGSTLTVTGMVNSTFPLLSGHTLIDFCIIK